MPKNPDEAASDDLKHGRLADGKRSKRRVEDEDEVTKHASPAIRSTLHPDHVIHGEQGKTALLKELIEIRIATASGLKKAKLLRRRLRHPATSSTTSVDGVAGVEKMGHVLDAHT
jgi:hypothetical protein